MPIQFREEKLDYLRYEYNAKDNIETDKLQTIETPLGSKTTDADRILVSLLCEKYSPKAKVKEIKLKGKV